MAQALGLRFLPSVLVAQALGLRLLRTGKAVLIVDPIVASRYE
ncbi:MAG TPA: hypothetical protein VGW37_03605 [Terriglobia bacterium]|nr:hypothetical protein [Terriglobia bacterium]